MSVPVEGGVSMELKNNNKKLAMGMAHTKRKEQVFLPALAVTASPYSGKSSVGVGSSGFGLWAEICCSCGGGHID
jgi:hypothetical protein